MTITTARRILREDIHSMPLEKLQRHKVRLLDAARESEADDGDFATAVKNGFYKIMSDPGATGFSPADIWLTYELWRKYRETVDREKVLLGKG